MPGAMNALWTFQRGQRPEKRANWIPEAEALGDVAGDVDANEVKRHALLPRAPQRRQPMADLLEAGAEAPLQKFDVVAEPAGGFQERSVRHQQRGGEVVGERDAAERDRVRRRQARLLENPCFSGVFRLTITTCAIC